MASGKYTRRKATLVHPSYLTPEDLATFVELPGFTRGCRELGLTDEDLMGIQMFIMASPKGAPVIPGTGGLRKARFAPARWGIGKRRAGRCCYAYFEDFSVVVLCAVYLKSRKDDLSQEEKVLIRGLLQRIQRSLEAATTRKE